MPESVGGGLARMIASHDQFGLATGNPAVDVFLRENPTAVLVGILLDQRIRAEMAFAGPYRLFQRLGHFSLRKIAEMDPDDFKKVFIEPPAIHRFANMMSVQTYEFARLLTDLYSGDATNVWCDRAPLDTIYTRLTKIKGFGPGKLRKFVPAMRLFGHALPGWP